MNCDFGKWFASLDAVALLLEQSKIRISSILSSFIGEVGGGICEGRARFCESSVVSVSFLGIFSGTFSSAVSISSVLIGTDGDSSITVSSVISAEGFGVSEEEESAGAELFLFSSRNFSILRELLLRSLGDFFRGFFTRT